MSTAQGCDTIRRAARERNSGLEGDDEVHERLKTISVDELFFYHVSNPCYCKYTHKKNVERAKKNAELNKNQIESESSSCRHITRSQLRNKSDASLKHPCLICSNYSDKAHSKNVHKISEGKRAQRLLEIAQFYKDGVYIKMCFFLKCR